jgi:hypothetical protein
MFSCISSFKNKIFPYGIVFMPTVGRDHSAQQMPFSRKKNNKPPDEKEGLFCQKKMKNFSKYSLFRIFFSSGGPNEHEDFGV